MGPPTTPVTYRGRPVLTVAGSVRRRSEVGASNRALWFALLGLPHADEEPALAWRDETDRDPVRLVGRERDLDPIAIADAATGEAYRRVGRGGERPPVVLLPVERHADASTQWAA